MQTEVQVRHSITNVTHKMLDMHWISVKPPNQLYFAIHLGIPCNTQYFYLLSKRNICTFQKQSDESSSADYNWLHDVARDGPRHLPGQALVDIVQHAPATLPPNVLRMLQTCQPLRNPCLRTHRHRVHPNHHMYRQLSSSPSNQHHPSQQ